MVNCGTGMKYNSDQAECSAEADTSSELPRYRGRGSSNYENTVKSGAS